jgi:hypothetical protein
MIAAPALVPENRIRLTDLLSNCMALTLQGG